MTNARRRPRVNWTAYPEIQTLIKMLAELHRRSESYEAEVAMEVWIHLNHSALETTIKHDLSDIYSKLTPEQQILVKTALLKAKATLSFLAAPENNQPLQ